MMNRYLLLFTWTLLSTCLASPDVHKKMSSEQLRSIFHVESHELVPNYEVIHLIHHGTTEHRISKRSITSTSSSLSRSNNQFDDKTAHNKLSSHHVKKDLSKSAYYSELKKESTIPVLSKWSSPSKFTNSIHSKLNPSNSNSFSSDTQSKLVKNSSSDNEFDIQQNENDDNYNNEYKQQFTLPSESMQDGNNGDSDSYEQIKTKPFAQFDLANIKEHNVSLSVFGQMFNLTLRPTTQLFKDGTQSLPMFTVNVTPNATHGLSYEPIEEEPSEHVGEVFQDERNMAAILMRRQLENGDLLMEGSIGHDMVIKPVPYGLIQDKNSENTAHHIVYKRKVDATDQNGDFAFMEPDRLQKRYRKKRSTFSDEISNRSKRAIPHIIYPEILVIVDYDGYRLHGGDNTQIKRYFVSFWNGVDLRYRLLKGPRIRISIAGIIISRGRDATPYLERNRVGRDAIDSAAALTDMGKYLFRERRLPVYDIAVAITKLDMCRRNYPTDVCNRGTAGFAYVGGACVVNKRLEKVNSVAIIEDTGGFSGIIVAAHEVGHLLGAVHDGSPPPSYLGGPGAEKCRWEDGFIMSDLRHTERGFRWSPCTIQSFHHFLNGDTASCLHNAPHEDDALGRALPGTLLSLDAQCRRDRGTSACFKDERVCAQLFCFDAASGYCVAYRPAAEGSPCGDGSHCLDGRCVAEHENIIPDYSQHTPSYASPNVYQQQSLNGRI
ncbi:venom metalloproteinase 3 isoform X4 [Contarinia nasturtii]|uniref:venom metalloproteinase 3 isoform X4 n=1 Tax=Contarinia nasturtii TaxID=265458 RepID=UPI0012D4953E|nr:venom metalloproteinase 3 isoform X4 [Contarinia nasturtii]